MYATRFSASSRHPAAILWLFLWLVSKHSFVGSVIGPRVIIIMWGKTYCHDDIVRLGWPTLV